MVRSPKLQPASIEFAAGGRLFAARSGLAQMGFPKCVLPSWCWIQRSRHKKSEPPRGFLGDSQLISIRLPFKDLFRSALAILAAGDLFGRRENSRSFHGSIRGFEEFNAD